MLYIGLLGNHTDPPTNKISGNIINTLVSFFDYIEKKIKKKKRKHTIVVIYILVIHNKYIYNNVHSNNDFSNNLSTHLYMYIHIYNNNI